jgi:hypothetical protein
MGYYPCEYCGGLGDVTNPDARWWQLWAWSMTCPVCNGDKHARPERPGPEPSPPPPQAAVASLLPEQPHHPARGRAVIEFTIADPEGVRALQEACRLSAELRRAYPSSRCAILLYNELTIVVDHLKANLGGRSDDGTRG